MSSSSEVQFPLLAWSAVCTCRPKDGCTCGAKADPNAAIRDEVTKHFLAFRHTVYRYLLHCGYSRVDAEDATQEAFVWLFRARLDGRVIEEPSVLPLTITVARRRAIDRLRRRRTEEALSQELLRNLAETLPDEGQNCEEELQERQQRAALMRALQELSALQRECLHCRSEGLSLRDTSAIVGVSEKRVSEAIHRGIRRLRKLIDAL